MPGGGSIQGMITSLKNNKRPRASAFKRLKGYKNVKYKNGKIEKKATPQQLQEIRERIQKQNKKEHTLILVFIAAFIILVLILFTFAGF